MAEYTKTLSGGSASSQYRIRMVVTESDVNINNNTSKVNVTAYIDKLKGTGYFSNDGKPWNIKIDGSTVASGNKTYNFRNYTTLTLGSGSKTITHNSDGSKSVAVSAYFNSSPYLGSATVSATFILTTIARASSISSITGGSELNQSVTVNISRKSNSFTHKVEYSYAGSSYITASTNAGTSCSFTPSISLASYVPNSTSGTLTVRVTTYNGSTQIGSAVTATKTLSVPSSVVPTMDTPSVTRIDNGVPSSWGVYVQSFSKATVSMTGVAGAYGSTIKSYSIIGGGLNSNSSSATTGVLNTSGTITFTCTIIDSRGRSATKTASINVAAYSPPSLSLSAERSDPSGTPNASAGTCAKVTATFGFASVSGKNSITSKSCSCNGQTNTSFASGTPFVLNANLNIGSSYTVTASITDALGRSSGPITASISSAKRIINVKANKNGMGIGKFAEIDGVLDVAWQTWIRAQIKTLIGGGRTDFNGVSIEIFGPTPFIDFHYGSDGSTTEDFTHRIIASDPYNLNINGCGLSVEKDIRTYAGQVSFFKSSGMHASVGTLGGNSMYLVDWINGQTVLLLAYDLSGNQRYLVLNPSYGDGSALYTFEDGYMYLGIPSARWRAVYATTGTIQTSDRNLKKDIKPIDEKYLKLFKDLKPVSYRRNEANSDRVHIGFISQDVEESLEKVGLTALDFAGFCKDIKQEKVAKSTQKVFVNDKEKEVTDYELQDVLGKDGNPEYTYSLRYEEFIALNTRMIQDLMAKVEDQQKIIDEQNKRLETLEAEILAIKGLLMLG